MEQAQPTAQSKRNADSKELIITLSVPDGDIVKVEAVDKAGKRQQLLDEDFATLVGDGDVEDLLPVLEQAYVAGFSDANSDVFESGDAGDEPDDDDLEQMVARGVASRRLIRRGVRKLLLGRLIKREMLRRQDRHESPLGPSATTTH
jgi:hypothetical protein